MRYWALKAPQPKIFRNLYAVKIREENSGKVVFNEAIIRKINGPPLYRGGGYKTGNMFGYKTGIMCGYKTDHSKIWIMGVFAEKKFSVFLRVQNTISAKGHFCGFDFYKTIHSKIRIFLRI